MSLRPLVVERRNSFKINEAELNSQGTNLKRPPYWLSYEIWGLKRD